MPMYLIQARFTTSGISGVKQEGGTSRERAVKKAVESLGGRLEAFYFGFGSADTYSIVELPDNESAAAMSAAVSSSGAAVTEVVVLLTPAQIDAAIERTVDYLPPIKG